MGKNTNKDTSVPVKHTGKFRIEWKTPEQKLAYAAYQQHDVLFLIGAAGTGKSHIAMSFAINDVLNGDKKKIIIVRPIVEAGESLGYLPGTFQEKVSPYMMPLYDCLDRMMPVDCPQKDRIKDCMDVVPLAYQRGRTFHDAVCILDEAQNCTKMQLKLFLTRFGENSKVIVTGDPLQSDLGDSSALMDVVCRLEPEHGISIIKFSPSAIVRHPLIAKIIARLED